MELQRVMPSLNQESVKSRMKLFYALTDVKETVVTENFYQPIPLSILKHYLPSVMAVE